MSHDCHQPEMISPEMRRMANASAPGTFTVSEDGIIIFGYAVGQTFIEMDKKLVAQKKRIEHLERELEGYRATR